MLMFDPWRPPRWGCPLDIPRPCVTIPLTLLHNHNRSYCLTLSAIEWFPSQLPAVIPPPFCFLSLVRAAAPAGAPPVASPWSALPRTADQTPHRHSPALPSFWCVGVPHLSVPGPVDPPLSSRPCPPRPVPPGLASSLVRPTVRPLLPSSVGCFRLRPVASLRR